MFDIKTFEKELATSWLGRSWTYFEELPSTNTYAKKLKKETSLHGNLVLTDHQTGGRGQYERSWETEAGRNLTFSLIFEPQKAERLTLLTLACALSVSEELKHSYGLCTCLKWPNDILIGKKKVCGILTEAMFCGNHLEKVIVGIGLNVGQKHFEGELKEKATSITAECNEEAEREKLLARILTRIEHRYRLWSKHEQKLVQAINRELNGFGEWTQLNVNNEMLDGNFKFLGVSEKGELLALSKDLDIRKFTHEQVRVHTLEAH